MVRFAHISDVHLGGWKQQQMQDLNLESFRFAISKCIEQKLDFVLISGDLFDTAYPGIDILKETFSEFKRLKEARIPCFIIAGSHDYSVSGKTFLEVLEKSGFCKNVMSFEERNNLLWLNPTIHEGIAIYGYHGKKSGLEIEDLRRVRLSDTPGFFKIFMLHTTLDKAKGTLPIDSISTETLPPADYYALGHLHIDFMYENFVYPGPLFPNNFQELEDLTSGSFYIVTLGQSLSFEKISIPLKEPILIKVQIKNALTGTDTIISEIEKRDIKDKIVLLRVCGEIESGEVSDIKFAKIEEFAKSKGAYFLLRNTHELKNPEIKVDFNLEEKNSEQIEEEAVKIYSNENPSDFNKFIPSLIQAMSSEKQEGEKTEMFESRIFEDIKKIFNIK